MFPRLHFMVAVRKAPSGAPVSPIFRSTNLCTAATAYENAGNLTSANRKVALGVVHLIELAQRMVDSLLDDEPLPAI